MREAGSAVSNEQQNNARSPTTAELRLQIARQQAQIVAVYRSGQHDRLPEENRILEQLRRAWQRAHNIEGGKKPRPKANTKSADVAPPPSKIPARDRLNGHGAERLEARSIAGEIASLTPDQARAARQLLGLTQVRLSTLVGVSAATIGKIELGLAVKRNKLGLLKAGLEAAGVEFLDGDGVRLTAPPSGA